MPTYRTMPELLNLIDEPNRSACQRLYEENKQLFMAAHGSVHNHQAWPGGYHDHVQEAMNIAVLLYQPLAGVRLLPFSLSDALLCLYLHDVEKPWKYDIGTDGQLHHKPSMQTKADHQAFRDEVVQRYGIQLTPGQWNGIRYAEGEGEDYSPRQRVMGPLAAFVHMCDVASARIWPNCPLVNDEWVSATTNLPAR